MKNSQKATNKASVPQLKAAGSDRKLNVHPDIVDLRDRTYQPALLRLALTLPAASETESPILDQEAEGACTGFAMAAAVNLLIKRRSLPNLPAADLVSPRMLYEMAKLHDEWPGETYDGSSVRGAMKGFFHNGVCTQTMAPYQPGDTNWNLTVDQAIEARSVGLGSYYRLEPKIIDYHAALNEAGAIVASARVHSGWTAPKRGIIKKSQMHEGGHAFVIVGYDQNGFLIQNSWGPEWGGFDDHPGIGHWSYADWAENVVDAWVMRLSVPTPEAFDLTHTSAGLQNKAAGQSVNRPSPRRHDVLGHIIHLDDGHLVEEGGFSTSMENIAETTNYLVTDSQSENPKYDHLMLYAHGGLNNEKASAKRVVALKEVFKRNKIYPVHFMWETGFSEELGDVFGDVFRKSQERVGFGRDVLDWTIERTSKRIGRSVWRQMKRDAERTFEKDAGGWLAVQHILKANARSSRPLKIHLVGHSAGSILLGELLRHWKKIAPNGVKINTMSLLAPACTVDYYKDVYRPSLGAGGSKIIDSLWQYNLTDRRELDDTVGPYGKSLLYFVSNAFEEHKQEPLLGMETFAEKLKLTAQHELFYAGRNSDRSDTHSHGGFDNDRTTMNDVLRHILGKKPTVSKRFQQDEMSGY